MKSLITTIPEASPCFLASSLYLLPRANCVKCRYLLRRAAGISDLEFSVNEIGMDASVPRNRSYLLTFLKVALPQLSAVFALHGNPLDLSLQQGKFCFFSLFQLI